jgi:nucleoside 2-deoxyribosyltransferase
MINSSCPICFENANKIGLDPLNTRYFIECSGVCGKYTISDLSQVQLKARNRDSKNEVKLLAFIQYKIKRSQLLGSVPSIDKELLLEASENPTLPKALEQADNLILWLGRHVFSISQVEVVELKNLIPIIGACNVEDVNLVMRYLAQEGLINTGYNQIPDMATAVNLALLIPGWEKFEELNKIKNRNLAFMAMKFNELSVAEAFFEFKKLVSDMGYELLTLTEKQEAGIIHNRLRVQIQQSRFVISDLTYQNQGVYWEAGYAEGKEIPVIYTCEENHFNDIHFDMKPSLTIKWSKDPSSKYYFPEALKELQATIINTLGLDPQLYPVM